MNQVQSLFDVIHYPLQLSGKGMGVVYTGNYKHLPNLLISLRTLRAVNKSVAVELWYERDFEADMLCELRIDTFQVTLRKMSDFEGINGILSDGLIRYGKKVFTIIQSGFESILFIDSDNLVLADPIGLFNEPCFLKNGALFWPDFIEMKDKYKIKKEVWALLGMEERVNAEIETGQLLVNKKLCSTQLYLAYLMNREHSFWYQYVYGDKDTFTIAWNLTRREYSLAPRPVWLDESKKVVRWHFDLNGKRIFQHSFKWQIPLKNEEMIPENYVYRDMCYEYICSIEKVYKRYVEFFY